MSFVCAVSTYTFYSVRDELTAAESALQEAQHDVAQARSEASAKEAEIAARVSDLHALREQLTLAQQAQQRVSAICDTQKIHSFQCLPLCCKAWCSRRCATIICLFSYDLGAREHDVLCCALHRGVQTVVNIKLQGCLMSLVLFVFASMSRTWQQRMQS